MSTHRLLTGAAAMLIALTACGSDGGSSDAATSADDSVTTIAPDDAADAADSGADDPATTAGNAPTGGSALGDVCALFTQQDAEAATGAELVLLAEQTDDSCVYESADPTQMVVVSVNYMVDAIAETSIETLAAMTLGFASVDETGGTVDPVPSISGALSIDAFGVPTVLVPHNDDVVMATVIGGDEAAAVAIAEAVAGNL